MKPAPPWSCTRVVAAAHRGLVREGDRVGGERGARPSRARPHRRVPKPRGAPDHRARCLDVHRAVGERERDRLEVADRLAERLALVAVLARDLERGAREPDAARRDERARSSRRSGRARRRSRRSPAIRAGVAATANATSSASSPPKLAASRPSVVARDPTRRDPGCPSRRRTRRSPAFRALRLGLSRRRRRHPRGPR